jgi:nicotinate-nucleotide pyrophosphorylase (carboxylating)
MTLDPGDLDRVVRAALEEDLRYGPDVTTAAVIPSGTTSVADIVARQPGTLAGLLVVAAVLDVACPAATFTPQARDGDRVAAGAVVARVDGPLAEILTAERTLLNFLTHLSGIATATRAWVDAIDGTGALVRDTRKTIPGLRVLEKYAVRCGGGVNHRMGLGDAALIKDNHIAAAGGVTAAFRAVLAAAPGVVTEVECDTLDQVGQALAAGAALILLDNMSPDQMRSAVAMARAYPAARLEASGGLRLENAREVADTGVHYLSVGALTHSSPALDLALDVGLSADGCQLPRPQDARTGDGRAMAEHVANYTRADVTKRERPLVTGARVPVVISSRSRGVFAVTAGGLEVRRGHVIYRVSLL